jgi:hypothetical protein
VICCTFSDFDGIRKRVDSRYSFQVERSQEGVPLLLRKDRRSAVSGGWTVVVRFYRIEIHSIEILSRLVTKKIAGQLHL